MRPSQAQAPPPRYRRMLEALACPTCRAALVEAADPVRLHRGACRASYAVEDGVPMLLTGACRNLLALGQALAGPSLRPRWLPQWLADWVRVHCLTGPGKDRHQRPRLAAFVGEKPDGAAASEGPS